MYPFLLLIVLLTFIPLFFLDRLEELFIIELLDGSVLPRYFTNVTDIDAIEEDLVRNVKSVFHDCIANSLRCGQLQEIKVGLSDVLILHYS